MGASLERLSRGLKDGGAGYRVTYCGQSSILIDRFKLLAFSLLHMFLPIMHLIEIICTPKLPSCKMSNKGF